MRQLGTRETCSRDCRKICRASTRPSSPTSVYSQALKGAEYMSIAKELEVHAGEELAHAITIAKLIDYLGGMPNATALPVKLTDDAEEMLRADLENENDTVRAYRERVRQCDALGEFAMSEEIREILHPGTGTPDRSRHRARRGRARRVEDEEVMTKKASTVPTVAT